MFNLQEILGPDLHFLSTHGHIFLLVDIQGIRQSKLLPLQVTRYLSFTLTTIQNRSTCTKVRLRKEFSDL